MNPRDFGYPLTFTLAPPRDWHFVFEWNVLTAIGLIDIRFCTNIHGPHNFVDPQTFYLAPSGQNFGLFSTLVQSMTKYLQTTNMRLNNASQNVIFQIKSARWPAYRQTHENFFFLTQKCCSRLRAIPKERRRTSSDLSSHTDSSSHALDTQTHTHFSHQLWGHQSMPDTLWLPSAGRSVWLRCLYTSMNASDGQLVQFALCPVHTLGSLTGESNCQWWAGERERWGGGGGEEI